MKRALITGSNGFVGPYLTRELEAHGFEVFGLGKEVGEGERYYQADITDKNRIIEIMSVVAPSDIVHLAGISSPPFAEEHSDLTREVNVGGTINLLEAAAGLGTRPRVLIVSSMHVYGEPEHLPMDEAHPLHGKGVYAASRLEQEQMAESYTDRLPIVVTRSFNHTGAGQADTFVIPKIVKQAIEIKLGQRAQLELGNINVKRDISDVRDVVRAYRLLLESEQSGLTANVCRGESISLKNVIERVKVLAGLSTVEIALNQGLLRPHDVLDLYGDHGLLTKFTGWQPEIGYDQMLSDMYEYWLAHLTT